MMNTDKYKKRLDELYKICLESYKDDRYFLKIEKYIIELVKEALENKPDKLKELAKIQKAKDLMDSIEFEYNDTYIQDSIIGTLLSGVYADKKVVSKICDQLSVISNKLGLITIIKTLNDNDREINGANILEELEPEGGSYWTEFNLKEDYLKKALPPDYIECLHRIEIKKYVQKYLIDILRELRDLYLKQIIRRLNLLFGTYLKTINDLRLMIYDLKRKSKQEKAKEKEKKEIEEITSKLKEIGYHFTGLEGDLRPLINYMTYKGKELYCQIEMSMALKYLTGKYDIGEQANKYIKSIWKLESEIVKKHIIKPEGIYFVVKESEYGTIFIGYFGSKNEELNGIVWNDEWRIVDGEWRIKKCDDVIM